MDRSVIPMFRNKVRHSRTPVTYDDVLSFLKPYSLVPSSLGSQLQKLRDGVSIYPDPHRATDMMHTKLLADAAILRCIDTLKKKDSIQRYCSTPSLSRFSKTLNVQEGGVAIGVLLAFSRWDTISKERGFAEIYSFTRKLQGKWSPTETMADLFRNSKAPVAYKLAKTLLYESETILKVWVQLWNSNKVADVG